MNSIKKLKWFYHQVNHFFEKQVGWFFINGRKGEEEFNKIAG